MIDIPARHVALREHEEHGQQDKHDADRGRHAEVAADLRGIQRVGFRCQHIEAATDEPRRAEIRDRVDERQKPSGRECRKHKRERDLHHALERREAEALCRLLERAIDVGERAGGKEVDVRIELEREDDEDAP